MAIILNARDGAGAFRPITTFHKDVKDDYT
jgi:hypothetical protein